MSTFVPARTPPFWDWALATWSRPEVERSCLRVQDEHGTFVPGLLFAAWCARFGQDFCRASLPPLQLSAWHEDVLTPVRAARRAVRVLTGPADAAYRHLRDCELILEKHLMDALAGIARPGQTDTPRDPDAVRQRFAANLQDLDLSLPESAQAELALLLLDGAV